MPMLIKLVKRCRADTVRRAIRCPQRRVRGLQILQLAEHLVPLGIADLRSIEHVVLVIGALEIATKLRGSLGGVHRSKHISTESAENRKRAYNEGSDASASGKCRFRNLRQDQTA